jgi:hypothetical protein
MLERELLAQPAAAGETHDVRCSDPMCVEHANRVGAHVSAAVARLTRRVGDRASRVALVVADHEPAAVSEQAAEPLLPPQHRCAGTHDQQQRRVRGVAERLHTELDPVSVDQPLGQPRTYS